MDTTMNESEPPTDMHQHPIHATPPPPRHPAHQAAAPDIPSTARSVPVGIVAAAGCSNTDPCDVACDAMPAHLVGDLTPPENAWLLGHTTACGHCAKVLHRYERVDDMLDRLHGYFDPLPTPPPFHPPKASRTSTRSRVAARAARRPAHVGTVDSPLGPLRVAVSDIGVAEISYTVSESEEAFRKRLLARGFDLLPAETAGDIAPVTKQLKEYFGGQRNRFDLPIDFGGITPFARSVLAATVDVPFGQLATYGDIAARIGSPGASRAVGNALGRNPIPVIVPCHRIVRSDSSIGGYTGGIHLKERLLAIEGVRPRDLGMD